MRVPFRFDFHRPYWIAMSISLPSDYVADYRGMSEVLFQVHNSPDEGEGYTNPMVAIEIDGTRWKIYSRWSDDVPTRKNVWDEVRVIDGGDMTRDRGTWVDWVVHAEFSWASNGFLAVYKNQVLVDSISGPTSTQDAQGPYVKFGIYKWPWMEPVPSDYRFNTSMRTVYFDDFKIGDSLNTLRSMSP